jgi:hypothetical protein
VTAATAEYVTDDPIDRVEEFYRGKLTMASIHRKDGKFVAFEIHGHGLKKIVVLKQELGRTHITLASIGEGAAN